MGKVYDEQRELADYVWRNCQKHIPPDTLKAYFFAYGKPPGQESTPEIEALLENGVEDLRIRVANEIAEHADIKIHRCSVCSKILRTPEAKICVWCD